MFERIIPLNNLMVGFCKMLLEDVPADSMATQPFAGANHGAWIIGHLAYVADRAGRYFGVEAELPASWETLFGKSSTPVADASKYPSKGELIAALEAANARFVKAAQNATPEQLAAANKHERLAGVLPTVGDLATMLLSTHMAQHAGQLSAWRRALGKAALF